MIIAILVSPLNPPFACITILVSSGAGELGILDTYDDNGPIQTRVTRSSSFPVDPKILHRKVSPQQSLDSDEEMKVRKPASPDDSTFAHPGMKGIIQSNVSAASITFIVKCNLLLVLL